MLTFHRILSRSLILLAAASLLPGYSAAQMSPGCHMAMDTEADAVPPARLPPPVAMTGIGNAHLGISRSNPEVQRWFDQGLNLFHDFWDYESARAFEQAVRLDPQCAICYWGLYQAENFRDEPGNLNATDALKQARALAPKASPKERLYIQAAAEEEDAKADTAGTDDTPDNAPAIATWRRVIREFPNDENARLFLASLVSDGFDENGAPRKSQKEAQALVESALKQQPDSSAANHYWIHMVEAGREPEKALPSARRLASLAPSSGHMVHMPGHIFYRTGDYKSAAAAFAASTETDERYLQTQHVRPADDWNYVHNLMYRVANLLEEGKLAEAEQLSGKLAGARGRNGSTLYPQSPRDGISRIDPELPVALRSGDYLRIATLVQAHPQPESLPHLRFLATGLLAFAQGMDAVTAGNAQGATASSNELDAALWRFQDSIQQAEEPSSKEKKQPAKASLDADPRPLVSTLSIMSLELRGAQAIAAHRMAEGQRLFKEAQRKETDLGYREPPTYIRPVGETEAAVLLAAGSFDPARTAYERALKERPNSGFPLYGLAQADEAGGDTAAAVKAYRKFLRAWDEANPGLPQVTHAHAFLAEHDRTEASLK